MRISILLIIGLLLGSITSHAQFTKTDSLFFNDATEHFQTWLASTTTANDLKAQGFELQNNKVTLKLTTSSRKEWISLRSAYYKFAKRHIGEQLLHRMTFHFEVPLDSAAITITSLDNNESYSATIQYEDGKISDTEVLPLDIDMKGGGGKYPISEMAAFSSRPVILKNKSEKDIKNIKKRVVEHLEGHYESKEQFWGREAKVEILEIDNEVSIEITNISKEVLNDFTVGYFELIIIDIFIHENEGNIEIVYNFRAKYGSGIFIAPRRSGYVDMSEDYPEYLRRYDRKVRKMIVDVATATPIKD